MSEFRPQSELSQEAIMLFEGLRRFMDQTKLLTMEQQLSNDLLRPYRTDNEHQTADQHLSDTIEKNVTAASEIMEDLHSIYGTSVFAPPQESESTVNLVAVHALGYDADKHRYYGLSQLADKTAVRCDIMAQEVVCQPGTPAR